MENIVTGKKKKEQKKSETRKYERDERLPKDRRHMESRKLYKREKR